MNEVRGDFLHRSLGANTVFFAEDVDFTVFDEFVRPSYAFDRGINPGIMEELDDGCAEAILEDMVFKRADHLTAFGYIQDEFLVQRLDEAWVDESDRVALSFKIFPRFHREVVDKAESDEGNITAIMDEFALSDLKEAGLLLRTGPYPCTSGIAHSDRAILIVRHGPEHIGEFVFVDGLHMDDVWNMAQVADVEEPVVGRSVIAG